jgi:hypothetical protein
MIVALPMWRYNTFSTSKHPLQRWVGPLPYGLAGQPGGESLDYLVARDIGVVLQDRATVALGLEEAGHQGVLERPDGACLGLVGG